MFAAFATVTAVEVDGDDAIPTVADEYATLLADARDNGVAVVSPYAFNVRTLLWQPFDVPSTSENETVER